MNPLTYFLGLDAKEGLLASISLMLIRVSLAGYLVFDAWLGYHYVYFGYNLFLWIGLGAIGVIFIEGMLEEEPKKDISVLDKEINEMKSKLDELEKEKAKEAPDYSEYNKKMDEQPPGM